MKTKPFVRWCLLVVAAGISLAVYLQFRAEDERKQRIEIYLLNTIQSEIHNHLELEASCRQTGRAYPMR
jgi:hypothetical protein